MHKILSSVGNRTDRVTTTTESQGVRPAKTNGYVLRRNLKPPAAPQPAPELSGLSYARLLFYSRLADQSPETTPASGHSANNTHPYDKLSVKLFATELQTKLQKNSDESLAALDPEKLDTAVDSSFAASLKKNYRMRSTSFKVKRLKFKHMVKAKNDPK